MTRKTTQTLPPLPPGAVLVDREGDVWRPAGWTADGDVLLVCDAPQNPEDAGEGPSFPWTLRLVEAAFGPLTQVAAGSGVAVDAAGLLQSPEAAAELERLRAELASVADEIARFGICGSAASAAKALVARADELVTENADLRARVAELEQQNATLQSDSSKLFQLDVLLERAWRKQYEPDMDEVADIFGWDDDAESGEAA